MSWNLLGLASCPATGYSSHFGKLRCVLENNTSDAGFYMCCLLFAVCGLLPCMFGNLELRTRVSKAFICKSSHMAFTVGMPLQRGLPLLFATHMLCGCQPPVFTFIILISRPRSSGTVWARQIWSLKFCVRERLELEFLKRLDFIFSNRAKNEPTSLTTSSAFFAKGLFLFRLLFHWGYGSSFIQVSWLKLSAGAQGLVSHPSIDVKSKLLSCQDQQRSTNFPPLSPSHPQTPPKGLAAACPTPILASSLFAF